MHELSGFPRTHPRPFSEIGGYEFVARGWATRRFRTPDLSGLKKYALKDRMLGIELN